MGYIYIDSHSDRKDWHESEINEEKQVCHPTIPLTIDNNVHGIYTYVEYMSSNFMQKINSWLKK